MCKLSIVCTPSLQSIYKVQIEPINAMAFPAFKCGSSQWIIELNDLRNIEK